MIRKPKLDLGKRGRVFDCGLAPLYSVYAPLGQDQGVLYHTPETRVESHLEECLVNVWPKHRKIQRIKLEATRM